MRKMAVTIDGQTFEIELEPTLQCQSALRARIDGQDVEVLIPNLDRQVGAIHCLVIDDRPYELVVDPDLRWVKDFNGLHEVKIREIESWNHRYITRAGPLKAPIPGLISQVLVTAGQSVESGQTLLVLEAMKMQNEIRAQTCGIVKAVRVSPGDTVSRGEVLIELERGE